jgi:glycerophosphoryl diester phosphodiesterase
MTADGHLVIMHDDTVDRTTDGSGEVTQMNLVDLKELDAGVWFGAQFVGQRVPTLDEALDLAAKRAQVSPSLALDLKNPSAEVIEGICAGLEKHGMTEDVVGIGAIRASTDVRRRFVERSNEFPCSVAAETPEDVDQALEDKYSKWVYSRFVPTPENIRQIHDAGKRLFVTGHEVSSDVNRACDAYRAGPDMVLTWHPTKLAELVGM